MIVTPDQFHSIRPLASDDGEMNGLRLLSTTFVYPNGEGIVAYARGAGSQVTVTDLQTTADFLEDRGHRIKDLPSRMTKALRDTTGVVLDGRELSVTVPIGEISEAVAGLIQAAITISSAVYHHRSAEASGFAAVVAKIIEQNAPREGLRIVRDWRDPVVDKSGAWPVDFRVDGESIDTEARNIFVVSNAAKLMRTAATTLFLKSHGERSVSAAIVDPHYRLTDRQTRRLQTSVDAIMFDVERRPQQLLKLLVA